MMNTKRHLAIAFCLLLFSTMGWAIDSAAVRAINDIEREALFPSRDLIEYGRAAAKANCAGCHGIDGISAAAGEPNLAGQRTVYLYRVLKAFQSGDRRDEQDLHNDFLNDQALISTAIYYAGLTPVKSPGNIEVPDNSQAAETEEDPFFSLRDAMRKCVKCHGETGNAGRSGMPSLTAQDPEYFVTSMMSYVDGSRSHKLMGRLVDQLDEATIRAMGVFYAVQE
ncbi:MAG: c-type cytochrome, partial [Gammaproteobacteria bacterium]|nr:c-type cytochrome [Gammaproteobacteria bacterium]